jgi:UDP-glucose 4-epimerase
MRQRLPITIYGDGTQTRDFIYVKDVAIAFAKALTTPTVPGSSLTCNLGTGQSTSLIQLIKILKTCFPDWKSEVVFAPPRLGDIQHSKADISKAFSLLGFQPQWSIQSGIQLCCQLLSVV